MYISPVHRTLSAKMCSVDELGPFRQCACLCQNGRNLVVCLHFTWLLHLPRASFVTLGVFPRENSHLEHDASLVFVHSVPMRHILYGFFLPLLLFYPRLFTYLSWSLTCMLNFQTRCWTWYCRHTVVCEMLCNGLP